MVFEPKRIKAALLGAAFFLLGGCASDPAHIDTLAARQGFTVIDVKGGSLRLAAFSRILPGHSDTLDVYIEGDGAPWITPYLPPRDPTPTNPVSFELAAQDPARKVVYLGRPCQYLSVDALRNCDGAFWTERRFAPEVVSAYDDTLNQIKPMLGVKRFRLVGFSGGGVIAALLAQRRDDVEMLITVAAPLAVTDWVGWHGLSPLTGSLDPAAQSRNIHMPFSVNFVGGKDRIVPVHIVETYVGRIGGRIVTIADFDHDCCWVRDWVELLHRVDELKGDI